MRSRVVCTLHLDRSGVNPMFASFDTLHEALATAQFDELLDLTNSAEGLVFERQVIIKIHISKPRLCDGNRLVAFASAIPTPSLPLFAAEICRRAPGVKVRWQDGWPHFSAPDDDYADDDTPDPVAPEELLPCLS